MTWTRRTRVGINNVHRRPVANPDRAWQLLKTMADPGNRIWPSDSWWPLILDAPATMLGANGGHGAIRYRVIHVTDRSIQFGATSAGFDGWHEFRVEGSEAVHELDVRHPSLLFKLVVIPLHDAVLEDLFDNLEDQLATPTGSDRPRHWTLRVRILRLILRPTSGSRRRI